MGRMYCSKLRQNELKLLLARQLPSVFLEMWKHGDSRSEKKTKK